MLKLKDFQDKSIKKIVSLLEDLEKKEIVIESPTGSGKTVILSFAIRDFLNQDKGSHCFFWFSPGNGELEEQSKAKFEKLVPEYDALTLDEAIRNGFSENQVVFVNWEMLNKKDNRALREQENKNLKDRIEECYNNGTKIIIIRDETHTHNTKIAEEIMKLFGTTQKVKVSATVDKKVDPVIDIKITEDEVIRSGLITKLISINEGISKNKVIGSNEEEILLNLAIEKQKEIAEGYEEIGLNLVPLIIIQYPNETSRKDERESSALLMSRVEEYLKSKGYSYDNELCACWLDGNKNNIDSDNQPLDSVIFLHTKQALATGWDCPRAKILVKLRDNMNETFEIQVLGRIRRMPEQKHYENDILNNCYLYTFDEKYKEEAVKSYGGKEAKVLYIKEEYKELDLGIYKENRPSSFSNDIDDKEKVKIVCDYIIEKYDLEDVFMTSKDKSGYDRNKIKLEKIGDGEGYVFDKTITISAFEGEAAHAKDLLSKDMAAVKIKQKVDNKNLYDRYKNAIWIIAIAVDLPDNVVRTITQTLFQYERTNKKRKRNRIGRVLNFNKRDYRIFVINNREQIIKDIKASKYNANTQVALPITSIVKSDFTIPEKDIVYLDSDVKNTEVYNENVYDDYTTDILRSLPEKRFEYTCIETGKVKWFYKNGDKGQRYFSVVYLDNFGKMSLFYPDYILMTTDDRLFIVETKGGEDTGGESRNIDKERVEKKFNALKKYVEAHNALNPLNRINFAFVRDAEVEDDLGGKSFKLYYNDTKWTEEMGSEWKSFDMLLN